MPNEQNPTRDRAQAAPPRRVLHEKRVAEALQARIQGLTYREIAEQVGVSLSQAHALVQDAIAEVAETTSERAEAVLRLELERLDLVHARMLALVEGDETADTVRIRAAEAVLRVSERRSKLLGLDSPTKTQIIPATNPLEGLTPEQLAYVAEHGELPPGVEVPGFKPR